MQRRYVLLTLLTAAPALLLAKTTRWLSALPTKSFKVKAGEARFGKHYQMKGVTLNTLDIKVSGRDTGGAMAVFEQTGLTPKGGPPLHVHPEQDEYFYVIEGRYRFQVGTAEYTGGPGDTIFLPRNVPHAFIQLSNQGRMLVSYAPAGRMEAFFKATDAWKTPPAKEEIARVFAAHGMRVVGLPLTAD